MIRTTEVRFFRDDGRGQKVLVKQVTVWLWKVRLFVREEIVPQALWEKV